MVVAGNQLFFEAADDAHGDELWVSDGTVGGTHMVPISHPGAAGDSIFNLTAQGARVSFYADDGTHGSELWVS